MVDSPVLVVFGYFEKEDLIYFQNIQDYFENAGIKIHLFGWKYQQNLFNQFEIVRFNLLEDPGSVKDINHRFVNINRQINHWKKIFEIYEKNFILKLRPDLRIKNIKSIIKKIKKLSLNKNMINIVNVTTVSPRYLNLVNLKNHYCDWLISGHTSDLINFIQKNIISEKEILLKKFRKNRFVLQAKSSQAEQLLFDFDMLEFDNKQMIDLKIRTLNYFNVFSIKYNLNFKKYFSPYRLICMGSIECFLYNKKLIKFLRFYPPFIRTIGTSLYLLSYYLKDLRIFKIRI
tara:strand:+ start:613 stop:1476 length:864 start_codon:yes stop_codon:yes gene_type:complete